MHRAAVWAPYAYAVLNARGRQVGEGGVRCNRIHNVLVCLERADDAARFGVPDVYLTIITACTPAWNVIPLSAMQGKKSVLQGLI